MVDFAALSAPFSADRVSWRVGSTTQNKDKGMALAFIDARDVMDRLDEVCGPGGWENRYPHANGKTVCEIAILCGDRWVTKSDGAGDTDVEKEKGALSDAFKRAAVRWGIGRYLYDLDNPWVKLEAKGRSYIIDPSEQAKLRALLTRGGAPATDHSGPYVVAATSLRTAETAEAFRAFWNANKEGLRKALDPAEYAKLVDVMQAEAKRFAPAKEPA